MKKKNRAMAGLLAVTLCFCMEMKGFAAESDVKETEEMTDMSTEKEIADPGAVLEQVTEIRIEDVTEDSYKEALDIPLTQEEVQELCKLEQNGELTFSDNVVSGAREYFALGLYDEAGQELDRWIVGFQAVKTAEGQSVWGISSWLQNVIQTHGLTADQILGREPGDCYLADMERATKVRLKECADNNFEEMVFCDLSEEEIQSLQDACKGVSYEKTEEEEENLCQFRVYDANGAALYILTVDTNGCVTNGKGWELKGQELQDWLKEILTSYGLA